jgi:ribosomal protein S10
MDYNKNTSRSNKLFAIIRGYDLKTVDNVSRNLFLKIQSEIKGKDMLLSNPVFLPNKIKRKTVLTSVFRHKNHFEHFGMIIFSRLICVTNPDTKLLLELAKVKHPSSVSVRLKSVRPK